MTIIREYRIVMPLSLEEYKIGQLFAVIRSSLNETGGGDGVEWIDNRPFDDKSFLHGRYAAGQYTYKIYHLGNKLPGYMKNLTTRNARAVEEFAWNAFPFCRVELKPRMAPKSFNIYVESMHIADRGETENALQLPPEILAHRQVIHIDIVKDTLGPKESPIAEHPSKFRSKCGRGPLNTQDWKETCEPVMCCYKFVYIECKWALLSGSIEGTIMKQYNKMFLKFHRELFCTMDQWCNKTIEEIRDMERDAMKILDKQRREGPARGTVVND